MRKRISPALESGRTDYEHPWLSTASAGAPDPSATLANVTSSDETSIDRAVSGPPDLSGSLDGFALAELFELFTATSANGVLSFGDPVGATLWIRDGLISYGTSPGTPNARELIVRQGIATEEQYDGAVSATSQTQSLHESLSDLFEVDAARIEGFAREQVITTAFEIVAVGAESFEFRAGESDPLGAAIRIDHNEVLAEAERRRDEWRRIAELIPSTGIVAQLSPELPNGRDGITITADEWPILAQLDGYRTAADVIGNLGQSAFEVCGVLYDLLKAGTIEVIGRVANSDSEDQ